jgi:hypothetical protein
MVYTLRLFTSLSVIACAQSAQEPSLSNSPAGPDITSFQTHSAYAAEIDIGSDTAILYGVDNSFPTRAEGWREQGYGVSLMTGIAWGAYDAYYGAGDTFKRGEIQTTKSGELRMHGRSTTVGYNAPTKSYVEFIKSYIDPAIEAGVQAIYLEEPEYWANTGWSEAFKKAWEEAYDEPWQPPDSSPDAQYRASKLKYELYSDAIREVFEHVKRRAREKGVWIECHVPTHSLINYAQWRIVSPESRLLDIPETDGIIAQVWTGTARSANVYRGVRRERTFETAYLEFGQMTSMLRLSGRKLWFLADPVEDNPDHDWRDYKRNYEATLIASLFWHEVARYEVMPWPDRIFKGVYPLDESKTAAGKRVGIPADYATELLVIANALNEMSQPLVRFDAGTVGIGVLVSDSMMFQRAEPSSSEGALSAFYGLALPLLKAGVPVEAVQLERSVVPGAFDRYRVLLLSYEHQKPLRPEYHAALDAWVRGGGCLIVVDDGQDPYNHVREWWNQDGAVPISAVQELATRLQLSRRAWNLPERVGNGFVRVVSERPSAVAHRESGDLEVRRWVDQILLRLDKRLETQPHLSLQRGPYVVAVVLSESPFATKRHTLHGQYIDLLDARLPVFTSRTYAAGDLALAYDVGYARRLGPPAQVLAVAARVRDEQLEDGVLRFTTLGPTNTTARARILLPHRALSIACVPELEFTQDYDDASSTVLLTFPNTAESVAWEVRF